MGSLLDLKKFPQPETFFLVEALLHKEFEIITVIKTVITIIVCFLNQMHHMILPKLMRTKSKI